MEMIVKKLANLIDVKTMVTLAVIAVFVVMALTGKVESESVMNVVIMVVSFYFGTQHQKKVAETPETVKAEEN